MGWFRRRLTKTDDIEGRPGTDLLPVPIAQTPALARTERALMMLAAQSGQLHASMVHLEHRVDAISEAVAAQPERPTTDDVMAARLHSARVAGELARLEVNLAARLDAVRAEIRALSGEPPTEIDLRQLTPVDTGWSMPAG